MEVEPVQAALFDATEFLNSPERMAAYLEDALCDPDPGEFLVALGVVARAKGMSDVARSVGVARPALYRSLSASGHPDFATVVRVAQALGLDLHVAPAAAATERKTA